MLVFLSSSNYHTVQIVSGCIFTQIVFHDLLLDAIIILFFAAHEICAVLYMWLICVHYEYH